MHPVRACLLVICCTLLFASLAARADSGITLNFKDADIREVAATIGQITHKNFIIDPRVQGRVTVISSKPINADAVYAAFLSVLEVHGLAAVPAGSMTKIVPALEARQMPGSAYNPRTPGDAIVTQVVQINNVSSAQLVPVLRPLMSPEAQLAAYPPSNMLIISDRAGNLTRILDIINRIDQPTSSEVEVIPLQNAAAGDIAQVITTLMQNAQQGGEAGPPLKVVADPRTNSIILSGDTSARLRVRALIARLDVPTITGNTQVMYLRYAKAKDIADELKNFLSDLQKQSGGGTGPGASTGQPPVSLIPDERTNSLVITAPPKIMRSVQDVVSKLDIRRAQVLVQAIEAELTSDKSAQLGITWAAESANTGAGVTDFSNTGPSIGGLAQQILSATNAATSGGLTTTASGLTLPQGLTLGVGKIVSGGFSFAALLNALAGNSDTNILSTPSIVTLDNQEADIKVAQQVPFVTGQYTNTSAGTNTTGGAVINPFQTVQRQDVGLELKITPQINEGNAILLKIDQVISNLTGSSIGGQPVTNTREIKTSVLSQDGEIIVLGGLLSNQLIESEQHVPVLGSIPLLGNLFKYRSTTDQKSNLMLFIQPTILRTSKAADRYTNEGYKYLRDLQLQNQSPVQLIPDEKRPVLKPFSSLEHSPPSPETNPAGAASGTAAQPASNHSPIPPTPPAKGTHAPAATSHTKVPAASTQMRPVQANANQQSPATSGKARANTHQVAAPEAVTGNKPAAVPPPGSGD
ncbi:MAG: type II secretion system secretin GspD [Gammaproteobacteria bacterium]|nr:type II secretion system secretin GspD [Gammaproteobacteria bacterium]